MDGTGSAETIFQDHYYDMRTKLRASQDVRPKDAFTHEPAIREIAMRNRGVATEYLYNARYTTEPKKRISTSHVVRLLHLSALAGWDGKTIDNKVHAGEFRDKEVEFGWQTGVGYRDVPEMVDLFSHKLDELISQCPPEKTNILAAWAYTLFTHIHPFADGNGRTGRALIEFIRYTIARRNNLPYSELRTANQEDVAQAADLTQIATDMNWLAPYGDDKKQSPIMRYYEARNRQETNIYFNNVKQRCQQIINTTPPIDELATNPSLVRLSTSLDKLALAKRQTTKILSDEEMRFHQSLTQTQG